MFLSPRRCAPGSRSSPIAATSHSGLPATTRRRLTSPCWLAASRTALPSYWLPPGAAALRSGRANRDAQRQQRPSILRLSGSQTLDRQFTSVRHPGRRVPARRAPLAGEDLRDQISAAAYAGLVEDGLQVVFDGVGGQ